MSNNIDINSKDIIKIRGVTEELVKSLGTINNELFINRFSVYHEFHVVADDFGIPADGIIGKDFLKFHKCIIDYEDMSLSFFLGSNHVAIPIRESPSDDTTTLPARAEVFRTFHLTKFDTPQFIDNTEIHPGVFMANSIAKSQNPVLRVLNTTDKIVTIPKNLTKSQNLSNFHIYTMNTSTIDTNRVENLSKIFKKQSPKYAHEKF